ncbi:MULTISPECIES: hypothetical protein [unclassified Gilliamella]|uniref:hypothetical protein n=1 Tax=unclassified Gilliamella TaxID=2685620 RepID=UPI00130659C2|nr:MULTISPECIES: hypothetical protein [unclassified Gilliamella]MWP50412.1 hypothetical protein [Gilliamella sp. Lep-s35]MWP70140.1 hypothetical protein [Gilliamella sp. Lep-s5]MWP78367.1 hypothetical protein [Gilliamella sp. Lep-s21]
MMFTKKNKINGDVLKYFIVINWNDREEYTTLFKSFIKAFNKFLEKNSIETIYKFELNYSSKKYSNDSFCTKNEIVYANGVNKNDTVSVLYSNKALNQIKKENEKELIDIILHFKEGITEEIMLEITELVNNIFPVTYGYGFELKKNQEITSESILKKTLFGVSTQKSNYKINVSIENGNIPKMYRYNFLNKNQVENNNIIDYKPISNNLVFYRKD